jgi:hypothetical protein
MILPQVQPGRPPAGGGHGGQHRQGQAAPLGLVHGARLRVAGGHSPGQGRCVCVCVGVDVSVCVCVCVACAYACACDGMECRGSCWLARFRCCCCVLFVGRLCALCLSLPFLFCFVCRSPPGTTARTLELTLSPTHTHHAHNTDTHASTHTDKQHTDTHACAFLLSRMTCLQDSKEWVMDVKYAPDGGTLAVATQDDKVYLYDATNGYLCRAAFAKHNSFVTHVDFSKDSQCVLLHGGYGRRFQGKEEADRRTRSSASSQSVLQFFSTRLSRARFRPPVPPPPPPPP